MAPSLQAAMAAAAWCALHSLLVGCCRLRPWARLAYNVAAGVTLLALLLWTRTLDAEVLARWHGPWQLLRGALLAAGVSIGWQGALSHDNGEFLGLRQLREGVREERPPLTRHGILGRVRHPWYLAGILVLPTWPGAFTDVNVAWRGVFMAYLVVGSWIEDARLARAYGEEFLRYRKEVPGLIPRPRRR